MSQTKTISFVLRSVQNQGIKVPCPSKAPILTDGAEGWQAFFIKNMHYHILE